MNRLGSEPCAPLLAGEDRHARHRKAHSSTGSDPRQATWVWWFFMAQFTFAVALPVMAPMAWLILPKLAMARMQRAQLDIRNLDAATSVFHAKYHRMPYGLSELVAHEVLETVPADPWGRPYRYWLVRCVPVVVSLGRDGLCGGWREDADLAQTGFVVHREECEARDR
jgi:general secretion pathway protein G